MEGLQEGLSSNSIYPSLPYAFVRCPIKDQQEDEMLAEQNRCDRFFYPKGVSAPYIPYVKWLGRIGYIAKGCVYAVIGGIATKAAVGKRATASGPKGAFLFIGTTKAGGNALIIFMIIGVSCYVIWRFWEAFTGQGSRRSFSRKKNFFKYRLSPFVSGIVYIVYTVYLGEILSMSVHERESSESNTDSTSWPGSWHSTAAGRAALAFIGIIFLIATASQLAPAFLGIFRKEFYPMRRWERILMYTMGHIGFFARAVVFLSVSILFFRAVGDDIRDEQDPISDSLTQFTSNTFGKVVLAIMGIGLIIYGLFAILSARYRRFPTLEDDPSGENKAMRLSDAEDVEITDAENA